MKKFIGATQVGKMLNVCEDTIHNWRRKNLIPYMKVGNRFFYDAERVINIMKREYEIENNNEVLEKFSETQKPPKDNDIDKPHNIDLTFKIDGKEIQRIFQNLNKRKYEHGEFKSGNG